MSEPCSCEPCLSRLDEPMVVTQWRVTGDPGPIYPAYDFTFDSRRHAQSEATGFVERHTGKWRDGPHLHERTVTYSEWRAICV